MYWYCCCCYYYYYYVVVNIVIVVVVGSTMVSVVIDYRLIESNLVAGWVVHGLDYVMMAVTGIDGVVSVLKYRYELNYPHDY